MARQKDDGGADDESRGNATRSLVTTVGHGASGGHPMNSRARNQIIQAFDGNGPDDMPYAFVEYPKHVTVNGILYVCANADDEAKALATGQSKTEAGERDRLTALAQEKGLGIDGRWKADKIADALRNAGYDPDQKAA